MMMQQISLKVKDRMGRLVFHDWTIPIALLALCLISYATLISKLGLYMDDWNLAWVIHFMGPSSLRELFAVDRPLFGQLYVLTSSLMGESPLGWQLFGILTRWLSCLACWWMLQGLWPARRLEATMGAFLFAVYPGFISQFIPITYSHHVLILALTLVSLGAMNWSLRRPRWLWPLFVLSIVLGGAAMFTMEYYFGLELLRPVFLWLILGETVHDLGRRFRRVALHWLPYLALDALFLAYRLATPTPRGVVTIFGRLRSNALATVLELGQTVLQDLVQVSLLAWKQAIEFSRILAYDPANILIYALIILGTAGLVIFYLAFLHPNGILQGRSAPLTRRTWALQSLGIGVFALLLGGIPVWTTNLYIELTFPWDRFTMAMMLGVSLVLAGVIGLLVSGLFWRIALVGALVGLGAGLHYQVALSYYQDWLWQKAFFQQLVWRIPAIQPGTLVLRGELPFLYESDVSLSAPLNWIYAPDEAGQEMPYLLYDILDSDHPGPDPYREVEVRIRSLVFRGSASQAIVMSYQPPGCLKVLDPARDRNLPGQPPYYRDLLPLSRLDLIWPDTQPAASSLHEFFGPELEHGWCYSFEKAELARQAGDWRQVAALGDLALEGGALISRRNASETLPFIEGYARTGQWGPALDWSLEAYQAQESVRLALCDIWGLVYQDTEPNAQAQAAFERVRAELGCTGF